MVDSLASNLRRLMACQGLTQKQLAEQSELNLQTLKRILSGGNRRPHARSLHRLAAGLGVTADALFRNVALEEEAEFDRATNPAVDQVLADHPRLCAGWTQRDFGELYSHFGTGGGLTYDGTLKMMEQINRARRVQEKTAVLLQTEYGDLVCEIIDALYRKIEITSVVDHSQAAVARCLPTKHARGKR